MNLTYFHDFCREFDYPEEAEEALLAALTALAASPADAERFDALIDAYQSDYSYDVIEAGLLATRELAALRDIESYSLELCYFILLSEHLRELYEARGIAYEIYHDSMRDLRIKLFECKRVYGIWGSFVCGWFMGWFAVDRFALGRLQYETDTLPNGERGLRIHIPGEGRLDPASVDASIQKAAALCPSLFPKENFQSGHIGFVCESWLLFRKHREMLPPDSNLVQFMDRFTIVQDEIQEDGHDLWRIFNTMNTLDLDALPADTELQRAYLKLLRSGERPGGAEGYFTYGG